MTEENPKRSLGNRLRIRLHRQWNHLPWDLGYALRIVGIVFAGEIIVVALLIGVGYAIATNILQLPIVVSFGVVELFAFLLARYFLGGRKKEHTIEELISIAFSVPKFAHLVIHYVDIGFNEGYPNQPSFVLNTKTNHAYWIPRYIGSLTQSGVVDVVEHDSEEEMYYWFNTNGVALERKFPKGDDLGLTNL